MANWYDPEGNPITLRQATELLSDYDKRVVDKTYVGEVKISTVWLGLDHSFGGEVPLIFETMVFWEREDLNCERWPTKEAAQAGHDRYVAWVRQMTESLT